VIYRLHHYKFCQHACSEVSQQNKRGAASGVCLLCDAAQAPERREAH